VALAVSGASQATDTNPRSMAASRLSSPWDRKRVMTKITRTVKIPGTAEMTPLARLSSRFRKKSARPSPQGLV
jgi:hypothetical protein